MTTRLKIDLSQGILEVEGAESFVRAIYHDFKGHFIENGETLAEPVLAVKTRRARKVKGLAPPSESVIPPPEETLIPVAEPASLPLSAEPKPEPTPESTLEPKPPTPVLPSYNLIEDLKLGAAEGHPSLVEFMDSKLPITNEERNLVFLYYLQHILKVKPITLDHVYTCYRGAKIRAPLNIENSLRITAEQRGWIKTAQNGNMSVTPEGKQYVEKQLPKKVKN